MWHGRTRLPFLNDNALIFLGGLRRVRQQLVGVERLGFKLAKKSYSRSFESSGPRETHGMGASFVPA